MCQSTAVRNVERFRRDRKEFCLSSSDDCESEVNLSSVHIEGDNNKENVKNIQCEGPVTHHTSESSLTKPTDEISIDTEEFFINIAENNSDDGDKWYATVDTSGTPVSYMLDIGTQVSVIPGQVFSSLQKKRNLHYTYQINYVSWRKHCRQR